MNRPYQIISPQQIERYRKRDNVRTRYRPLQLLLSVTVRLVFDSMSHLLTMVQSIILINSTVEHYLDNR